MLKLPELRIRTCYGYVVWLWKTIFVVLSEEMVMATRMKLITAGI